MIPNVPDRIFLSGFMGAGKSTVGRLLAEELEQSFVDLDDKIEEQDGRTIPAIFEESREAAFRRIERGALMEVVRNFEGIVALGGGSLQNQHIVDHLKLNGLLIFIKTPISVILRRISDDEHRPLLTDDDGRPKDKKTLREELQKKYDQRAPLYKQAVITIEDNGNCTPQVLAKKLVKKIRNHVEY
ncbi:shikimate kinase [Fodinibius salinus]|uniref:Shikimate kinase n=1 Tax=Fodinibius salinus TaxID=860790 RepID=A0A5D3YM60_9BACT|nr:shikimate kinase [Fodinibius salinus]TYP94927.1 shikimate kinase [Fodinibius salinus]